ncbi:hypothetical protein JQX13_14630 [Archangium violaceum]|uniref:hypothetical protein n=1 Tax=Archangium violaceum TaxID=83451 RepID=UPI00193B12BB|nr:hypothetical protein [Archangium violaceum]QRK11195.1 hypothetical protein JQX13_14630 [Archangium violaceum]
MRSCPEAEERFRGLLRSSTIRAYHCTRLLEHEFAGIRAEGLRRLTPELVLQRIDRSLKSKVITRTESARFRKGHAFALGEELGREGKVCLFSCRQIMDDAEAVENLLGIWGGEAIYSHVGSEWENRLRTLGRPAIVAVDVDLTLASKDEEEHYIQPDVLAFFIEVTSLVQGAPGGGRF